MNSDWTKNLVSSDEDLAQILKTSKKIAVIGLSDRPEATSYEVSEAMQGFGFKIIPINPKAPTILGEVCFASVDKISDGKGAQLPGAVDIVNIFRRPEFIPAHADEILKMKPLPRCVWMQLGIYSPVAAQRLAEAGILVVQDRCIKVEAYRLLNR